jgi:3-oxoadipate enol-lactonase
VPKMEANGVELNYRFDGPENAPVVVMSNSLSTSLEMWDWQLPALTDKYRTLRWDKRGHGGSAATPPPYDLAMLVEDIRNLMLGLGVEQAHYVGLSTGGAIGQLFAIRYPEMISSLVLCDTSSYVPPDVWDGRMANARKGGMEAVAHASMERWFTPAFRASHPEDVGIFRRMVTRTRMDGYIGCASALKQRMLRPLLKTISAQTLVIVGADDLSTPVEHSEIIHREIEGSELVVIEDAAHISNVAQPDIFNRTLRTFLDHY